jgi:glucose-1-phosphate thymidylyltransferase
MQVLILAGGFATRLWPLTERRAKPLLSLAGKPLISHIIEKIPVDFPIIISTNKVFKQDFEELIQAHPDHKISIFIEDSKSDKQKMGALRATSLAIREKKINEPLMLLAGDNYFDFPLTDLIKAYKDKPILAVYDTKSLHEAKKFGVVTVNGKKVISFAEKPSKPKSTLVSTGLYIFPSDVFKDIRDYAKKHGDNLGGIFEYLMGKTEVHAHPFEGRWIDIGSFQAYLDAHKELYNEQRSVSHEVRDSLIGECVSVGDKSVIINSEIENTIIGKNCIIRNCQIKNSVIDDECKLDGIDLDHKMIRAGSQINI